MSTSSTESTKVASRLVALLIICYLISYIDRITPAFATETMTKDLGLAGSDFGDAQSALFLAFFIFAIPSAC
jgi:hypothetical protein